MKEFFDKINEFLKDNTDGSIRFPANVHTVLDEKNSSWSFTVDVKNSTDTAKEIALLTGNINSDRFVQVDASGRYTALGGQLVQTPYAAGSIINLKDDPRLIKKIVGGTIDAVASQEHHNGATEQKIPQQVIYKDLTGEVAITSKDFYLNFLRDFIKTAAVRSWEMHISSDNTALFNEKITLQEINPFIRERQEFIELEQYFSDVNTIGQKIIIDRAVNLTEETFMLVKVPANTNASFGLRVSAYHSNGIGLKTKLGVESFIQSLKDTINKNDVKKETLQTKQLAL